MIKVCFIYDGETNEKFLEILSKMTPNRSGKWKDMVGVTKIEEADWCVVIDSTTQSVPLDRTIFVSAHPKMSDDYPSYVDNTDKPYRLDNAETFGFGEWWVNFSYDALSAMKRPNKSNKTCYIVSNTSGKWGRSDRKEFAKMLSNDIGIYGRIQDVGRGELGINTPDAYWFGKEDVLRDHKYSVEVDHGFCKHYFSERVFDSLLMWCMPLYWGCTNIEDYLPKECFKYIDIYGDGQDVINPPEPNYKAIAEARDMLLNKYQIWAWTHAYIKGL